MHIDVHVHAAPPRFLAALGAHTEVTREGGAHSVAQGHGKLKLGAAFADPATLVARLDTMRIDVALISLVPLLLGYRMPVEAAAALAAEANAGLAEFAAAAPLRLRWLAHVPLQDAALATVLLEQAMAAGALGAQIGTNVSGANLDDPRFADFFAAAARLKAFVLVHAVDCLAPERLTRHYASNIIGNPYEAGLAVGSVILGQVAERAPGMHMCFCHGGGAAPALAGRWDQGWSSGRLDGTVLPRAPSRYFRNLWFDTLVYGEEQLRLLAALAGPDRLLLGSDAPFPIAEADPVGFVKRATWLSAGEQAAILGGNAAALLGLTGTSKFKEAS
jgi:aminocarboxymuconate-semialdehyde decarboxylase